MSPLRPATLATHTSAPIAEDVIYTDKVSQNLHAELLLHALGRVVPCWEGSTVAGARLIRAFLIKAGISPDDFLLYDGSGLSSHDLVAPRALTQLLAYAAKQPWFADFKAALPVGGIDGSLTNRFTGDDQPQLKGKVFAKTGSLGESRALSGYLTAASGQTLVFSLMDDNHPPANTADRTLMDQILALIAAAN
jgi:D-alanyl-D-alanine carboxypeptidase/D-alanyl-D-alanine-endopeptidase (penicillin-binding protein 4)